MATLLVQTFSRVFSDEQEQMRFIPGNTQRTDVSNLFATQRAPFCRFPVLGRKLFSLTQSPPKVTIDSIQSSDGFDLISCLSVCLQRCARRGGTVPPLPDTPVAAHWPNSTGEIQMASVSTRGKEEKHARKIPHQGSRSTSRTHAARSSVRGVLAPPPPDSRSARSMFIDGILAELGRVTRCLSEVALGALHDESSVITRAFSELSSSHRRSLSARRASSFLTRSCVCWKSSLCFARPARTALSSRSWLSDNDLCRSLSIRASSNSSGEIDIES